MTEFFELTNFKCIEKRDRRLRKIAKDYNFESTFPFRVFYSKFKSKNCVEYALAPNSKNFVPIPTCLQEDEKILELLDKSRVDEALFTLSKNSIDKAISSEVKMLMAKFNLKKEDLEESDDIFDELLILATAQAYKTVRVPGKHDYSDADKEVF